MAEIFVGTEVKVSIDVTAQGFDMSTDPWTATVRCGNQSTTYTKDTAINNDGEWMICVDTASLGAGIYDIVMEIDVPDNDMNDGYRHEVCKKQLMNVLRV